MSLAKSSETDGQIEDLEPLSAVSSCTSSSTLLQSSALAKFNKIIDNTVSTKKLNFNGINGDHQQQNNLNGSLTARAAAGAAATTTSSSNTSKLLSRFNVFGGNNSGSSSRNTDKTTITTAMTAKHNCNNLNDNQTKRNDVHYLLKHLNSFSDIEEIEIVERTKTTTFNKGTQTTTTAKTTTTTTTTSNCNVNNLSSGTLNSKILKHLPIPLLPQHYYDDYIFQSCHYLDTSCFATTITTAISGMGSGIPNDSGVIGQISFSTNTSSQSQSYENFLDHATSNATTGQIMATRLRRNGQSCSGSTTPCSSPTTFIHPTAMTTTTTKLHDTTTRLVDDEFVRTELSPSTSCTEQQRRKSFFKCCYAPIDRWREKRQQHHQQQQQQQQQQQCNVATTICSGNSAMGDPV